MLCPDVISQESVWTGPVLGGAGGFSLSSANYIIHSNKIITHLHRVGWPDWTLYLIYFFQSY